MPKVGNKKKVKPTVAYVRRESDDHAKELKRKPPTKNIAAHIVYINIIVCGDNIAGDNS